MASSWSHSGSPFTYQNLRRTLSAQQPTLQASVGLRMVFKSLNKACLFLKPFLVCLGNPEVASEDHSEAHRSLYCRASHQLEKPPEPPRASQPTVKDKVGHSIANWNPWTKPCRLNCLFNLMKMHQMQQSHSFQSSTTSQYLSCPFCSLTTSEHFLY